MSIIRRRRPRRKRRPRFTTLNTDIFVKDDAFMGTENWLPNARERKRIKKEFVVVEKFGFPNLILTSSLTELCAQHDTCLDRRRLLIPFAVLMRHYRLTYQHHQRRILWGGKFLSSRSAWWESGSVSEDLSRNINDKYICRAAEETA